MENQRESTTSQTSDLINQFEKEAPSPIVPLAEKEIEQLNILIKKYLKSYMAAKDRVDIKEWLKKELGADLPDRTDEEILSYVSEIIDTTQVNETYLKDLQDSKRQGLSTEQWFSNKVMQASSNIGTQKTGFYLEQLDRTICDANTLMFETITTKAGTINQNPNLDGYISETYKTNTFNLDAALKGKAYNAEVLTPESGVYGKNSLDIQVRDETGKVVRRYQDKMGLSSEATQSYFDRGVYNGQRKLVPSDQVDQIKQAVDKVSYNEVEGLGLSKPEAKELQQQVQDGNIEALYKDWSHFELRELSYNIGKQAAFSGIAAAGFAGTFQLASSVLKGEETEKGEVIEAALLAGADAGIKSAVSGAVKVASEKGFIKLIPKGTPAGMIANIVYVGIENLKVLKQVASGDLNYKEALEKMGETTASVICGIISAGIGSDIGLLLGATIGMLFGPVGFVIGAGLGWAIGSVVGYSLGTKIGNSLAKVANTIAGGAVGITKAIVSTGARVIRRAAEGIKNAISNIGERIINFFS